MKASAVLVALLALTGCVATPAGTKASAPYRSPSELEDGFYVRTFPDGSGSVSEGANVRDDGWSIDCRVDAMTDKRKCLFYFDKGGVFVYYGYSSAPESICISGHDFPGKRGQIRVGSNPPVTTNTDGCVPARSVLAQLNAGEQVTTRSYRWPYEYAVDTTTSLRGFNKTMEVVERIRSGG